MTPSSRIERIIISKCNNTQWKNLFRKKTLESHEKQTALWFELYVLFVLYMIDFGTVKKLSIKIKIGFRSVRYWNQQYSQITWIWLEFWFFSLLLMYAICLKWASYTNTCACILKQQLIWRESKQITKRQQHQTNERTKINFEYKNELIYNRKLYSLEKRMLFSSICVYLQTLFYMLDVLEQEIWSTTRTKIRRNEQIAYYFIIRTL